MRYLIIEDEEYKYNHISKDINKVDKNAEFIWCKSRNDGLFNFYKRNVKKEDEPINWVITDNYLPLCEGDRDVEPFADDIIEEVRRLGFEDIPIVVCSSNYKGDADFNYKIKYDCSVDYTETFDYILADNVAYMATK